MKHQLAGPLDREALRGLTRRERLRIMETRRDIRRRAAAARTAANRSYLAYLAGVEADTPTASEGLRAAAQSRRRMAARDLAVHARAGYGPPERWGPAYRRAAAYGRPE